MEGSQDLKRIRRDVADDDLKSIAAELDAAFNGVWLPEARETLAELQRRALALFREEIEANRGRECFLEMKDYVTRQNDLYRDIYAGTLALIRTKESHDLNSLQALVEAIGSPAPDRTQWTDDLCLLLADAYNTKHRFYDSLMTNIARDADVTFEPARLKGIWRCLQKTAGSGDEPSGRKLMDMVRGALCSQNVSKLMLALAALQRTERVQITRIKNRFGTPTESGWADLLVNFYFLEDPAHHICEVQFIHSKMMLVRKPMGAHESYAEFRRTTEIMEQLYQLDPEHYVCLSIQEGRAVRRNQLHLNDIGLTGPIPACLRYLTCLQVVILSGNQLTGPIPTAFCALRALRTLDVTNNELSGEVPREIVELPRLTQFFFVGNPSLVINDRLEEKFSLSVQTHALGVLFECTGGHGWKDRAGWLVEHWSSLLWCGVRTNFETGNVEELRLNANNLRGHLPASIGLLRHLRVLQLSHNQLIGSIPESVSNLVALEELDLSHNQLTGAVPESLRLLSDLRSINLQFNPALRVTKPFCKQPTTF